MRASALALCEELKPKPPEWNISRLAKHLKVSRPTVHRWIRGELLPTFEQIIELERLFARCPRDGWLIELPPEPKEKKPNDHKQAVPRRARRGRP